MKMRKLLLVTYHFPPSSAVAVHRLLGFACNLPQFGWDTVVVAPPDTPGEPVDPALVDEIPTSTQVHSVPYPGSWARRLGWRLFNHNLWLPKALAACAKAIRDERPDCVLTSSPPHNVHYLGWFLKRRFRLPWVVDFRDPWIINSSKAGSGKLKHRMQASFERTILRQADHVIANTPLTQAGFQAAHPDLGEKISVVTNGYDTRRFPSMLPFDPRGRRPTLLHAGELYGGRDPRPLLDALANLEKRRSPDMPPWRFVLLGQSTDVRFDFRESVRERGLEHIVEFVGQVPYAQALQAMMEADILVVIHTPGLRYTIPAKLFEYVGAGKPILALAEADGDVGWALRATGAIHRIAPAGDAGRIEQAILELHEAPCPSALERSNFESQRLQFTRHRQAQILAEILDGCVKTDLSPEIPGKLSLVTDESDPQPVETTPRRPRYAGT